MTNRLYYIRYFFIRIFRLIAIFIGLLLFISLFLFSLVDRPPLIETEAYQKTMAQLDSFKISNNNQVGDTIKVGWGKSSITPDRPTALAGYGGRQAEVYQSVHDSVFVRSFVFEGNSGKQALVIADLLIFPPEVIKKLTGKLPEGITLSNTYFSATHSHSSIGGWQTGFVGKLFAGEYDEKMVNFIADRVINSLEIALASMEKASIGYKKINQKTLIRNRLVKERGTVDPWLRIIVIEKISGESACIFNYAAHPTCLSYHYADLSADYPGKAIELIEKAGTADFVAYTAGAVGSMSPEAPGLGGYEKVDFVADQLAEVINATTPAIELKPLTNMQINDFEFNPGDPQFKVTADIRLKEWVFNQAFGRHEMEITSMRIGNLLLVGVPCDFSGELVDPLEKYAARRGMDLIITSFNGGYAGYVTKDEWYDLNKYETRTMNWYGHEIGKYMSESITKIIDGYAEN